MNLEEWMNELSAAYLFIGEKLTEKDKEVLLANVSREIADDEKGVIETAFNALVRYFFNKVAEGEGFCPEERIKEKLGTTLAENYSLSEGPFIDLARTYWTYKLEVAPLFPDSRDVILSQLLAILENDIGSIFFPAPGAAVPIAVRRETQRKVLEEYAPSVDIDRFLSENPLLTEEAGEAGKEKEG